MKSYSDDLYADDDDNKVLKIMDKDREKIYNEVGIDVISGNTLHQLANDHNPTQHEIANIIVSVDLEQLKKDIDAQIVEVENAIKKMKQQSDEYIELLDNYDLEKDVQYAREEEQIYNKFQNLDDNQHITDLYNREHLINDNINRLKSLKEDIDENNYILNLKELKKLGLDINDRVLQDLVKKLDSKQYLSNKNAIAKYSNGSRQADQVGSMVVSLQKDIDEYEQIKLKLTALLDKKIKELNVQKDEQSGIISALESKLPFEQLNKDVAELQSRSNDYFLDLLAKRLNFYRDRLDVMEKDLAVYKEMQQEIKTLQSLPAYKEALNDMQNFKEYTKLGKLLNVLNNYNAQSPDAKQKIEDAKINISDRLKELEDKLEVFNNKIASDYGNYKKFASKIEQEVNTELKNSGVVFGRNKLLGNSNENAASLLKYLQAHKFVNPDLKDEREKRPYSNPGERENLSMSMGAQKGHKKLLDNNQDNSIDSLNASQVNVHSNAGLYSSFSEIIALICSIMLSVIASAKSSTKLSQSSKNMDQDLLKEASIDKSSITSITKSQSNSDRSSKKHNSR